MSHGQPLFPLGTIRRKACRVCGGHVGHLTAPLLDLGTCAISDFPTPAEAATVQQAPLALVRCNNCTLVQLTHTVPRTLLYKQYWYRSGINEAMVEELGRVVMEAIETLPQPLQPGDVVMDIGANDGTLLGWYRDLDVPAVTRIAWEPAENLRDYLTPHSEIRFYKFFPPPSLSDLARLEGQCKIITAIAMAYDLEDPVAFFTAIAHCLHPQGIAVIQLATLIDMIATGGVDAICHEHLEYYTLSSLSFIVAKAGLEVLHVTKSEINGGSVRVFLGHKPTSGIVRRMTETHRTWLALERSLQVTLDDPTGIDPLLAELDRTITTMRTTVVSWLQTIVRAGGTVDLYGASTKGNTLLQILGLTHTTIRQAIERSEAKIGRLMGATGIPIVNEHVGRSDPATAWLVPIWQFRDVIIAREREYLAQGGTLIFPLPTPEQVRAEPDAAEANQ